jgi:PAS domain-containing protein
LAELLDAYPAPTLVVDEEVRLLFASRAAREYLGLDPDAETPVVLQRSGHVLHCLNADVVAEGCGRAAACKDCVVRNSVRAVLETGTAQPAKAFLQLRSGPDIIERFFLIRSSAVRFEGRLLALLVLEDISELMQLRNMLPVCMGCGQIRNQQGAWQKLPVYLKEQADVDVTHGLCPPCLERLYPE